MIGLRTGALLADLAMLHGPGRGESLVVASRESPELLRAEILGDPSLSRFGASDALVCGESSSPTFTDCSISGSPGDGVHCETSSAPRLTGCAITGNAGTGVVAGAFSSPVLIQCAIQDNSRGGLHCLPSSTAVLTGCLVTGNRSEIGAGICSSDASPTITDTTIRGNSANGGGFDPDILGGGLLIGGPSSPRVIRSTVAENTGGESCASGGPSP